MGLDTDFTAILREFMQFLESLSDVKLPSSLENVRENLLSRSKATLLNLTIGPPSSPEPYLDMNAGKGLLLAAKSHNEIHEYINADQNSEPRTNQDYYETFQEINDPKSETSLSFEDQNENPVENTLLSIYLSLSAAQMKATCNKCGQLSRKGERKIIPFIDSSFRSCWVGLVGSHLLIYGSEKDSRPNSVIPIREYRGRPAPSIDSKRSESAFEIFCPGHKTLQFVAKTPEEMEEWVSVICEMSTKENDNKSRLRESSFTETMEIEQKDSKSPELLLKDERYQNTGFRPSKSNENLLSLQPPPIPNLDKDTRNEILLREKSTKDKIDDDEIPPLPARIPRRLPSLPHEEAIPNFEPVDEPYDEDDIYHKIEDFRDATGYQNIMVAKKEEERKKEEEKKKEEAKKKEENPKNCFLDTYDDVDDVAEGIRVQKIEEESKLEDIQEAYDDVQPATQEDLLKEPEVKKGECVVDASESYDDVQTIVIDLKARAIQEPKEENLSGSARILISKKSFLDKMRNRSYKSKKDDKKKRGSTSTSTNTKKNRDTYDDISRRIVNSYLEKEPEIEVETEYLSPPAPRPIHLIPPTVTNCSVEQLYDDIAACQEKTTKESEILFDKSINSTSLSSGITKTEIPSMKLDIIPEQCFNFELKTNGIPEMEFEHYQTPRSDRVLQVEDVLYDDVALYTKFKSKPRESTVSNFEKVWSRFSSGKSKSSVNEPEESNDSSYASNDQQEVRVNRFQKLVNKIENTLGKSSVKPLPLSNSKSQSSSSVVT